MRLATTTLAPARTNAFGHRETDAPRAAGDDRDPSGQVEQGVECGLVHGSPCVSTGMSRSVGATLGVVPRCSPFPTGTGDQRGPAAALASRAMAPADVRVNEIIAALADLSPQPSLERGAKRQIPLEWFRWLPLRPVARFAAATTDAPAASSGYSAAERHGLQR